MFAGIVLLVAVVQWQWQSRPSSSSSAAAMDDSSMHSVSMELGPESPQAPAAPQSASIALRLSPAVAPAAYEQVLGSTRNSLFVTEGDEDDDEEQADGAGLQMVDLDLDRGAP